jgi:hypothetical protein
MFPSGASARRQAEPDRGILLLVGCPSTLLKTLIALLGCFQRQLRAMVAIAAKATAEQVILALDAAADSKLVEVQFRSSVRPCARLTHCSSWFRTIARWSKWMFALSKWYEDALELRFVSRGDRCLL